MLDRLKHPLFIAAIAGFTYQILKHFNVEIDQEMFKLGADLISYMLIGSGIYSTFPRKEK